MTVRLLTGGAVAVVVAGAALTLLAAGGGHPAAPRGDSSATPSFVDRPVSSRAPSFATAQPYRVDDGPSGLAAADVNGDRRVDIVAASATASTVSVLLGQARGGFGRGRTYAVGRRPESVTVTDLNGDGRIDIVTVNHFATGSVLLGTYRGFRRAADFATGANTRSVAAGDLDGDGNPDLVTSGRGELGHSPGSPPAGVTILYGGGDGSFARRSRVTVGFHTAAWVALADLNRDGVNDIATADADGYVSVLIGTGGGRFRLAQQLPTGGGAEFIVAADADRDPNPDLVTANGANGTGSVLFGRGDGGFAPERSYRCCGDGTRWAAVGDLNGDTVPDLVFSDAGYTSVDVLLGRGGGQFGRPADHPLPTAGRRGDAMIAADVNGDGRIDLVRAVAATRSVDVLINTTH